ncbi:hypothetical protein MRB53_041797 [Persea americana]|nr:hypothetical protein MRB53_041797 [Persea americana]
MSSEKQDRFDGKAPDMTNGAPSTTDPEKTNGTAQHTVNGGEKNEKKDDKDKPAKKDDDKDPSKMSKKERDKKNPPGGFDSTPVPHAPPGYTVKITFHKAIHLPMADLSTLSSDPYLTCELKSGLQTRHKEDPPLSFRTHTIWKSTDPEWNEEWIVAHVPASGFKLKARIYDEDASDQDDRLGNVHVHVGEISQGWAGIKNQPFKIKKKSGSWRAYALRALAVCFGRAEEMSGRLFVSVEVLGKSEGNEGGRAYTLGLNYWTKHTSPLLGRITGKKAADDSDDDADTSNMPAGSRPASKKSVDKNGKKIERYNFQANQFQLKGPIPADLYHRFVEFRPIIATLFTAKGIGGAIMHRALHHQHAQVYNYNRQTKYGVFKEPCTEMTQKFLELVHYNDGGRIFTYVLTLDALMRFTETGKEFGIDLLSKHTMHSDASIYIAFSGEFFVRRNTHGQSQGQSTSSAQHTSQPHDHDHLTPPTTDGTSASRPRASTSASTASGSKRDRDPSHYELIIDNDSGTYRPNAAKLPLLKEFLSRSLPGLKITTLDCQADAEKMSKMKDEQRARKEESGEHVVYTQGSRRGSVSSSDEERLDALEGDGQGKKHEKRSKLGETLRPIGNEVKAKAQGHHGLHIGKEGENSQTVQGYRVAGDYLVRSASGRTVGCNRAARQKDGQEARVVKIEFALDAIESGCRVQDEQKEARCARQTGVISGRAEAAQTGQCYICIPRAAFHFYAVNVYILLHYAPSLQVFRPRGLAWRYWTMSWMP